MYFATLPNCWNPLRAFDTKKYKKLYFGQEKNLGYGDNSKDWAISSQFLNLVKIERQAKTKLFRHEIYL